MVKWGIILLGILSTGNVVAQERKIDQQLVIQLKEKVFSLQQLKNSYQSFMRSLKPDTVIIDQDQALTESWDVVDTAILKDDRSFVSERIKFIEQQLKIYRRWIQVLGKYFQYQNTTITDRISLLEDIKELEKECRLLQENLAYQDKYLKDSLIIITKNSLVGIQMRLKLLISDNKTTAEVCRRIQIELRHLESEVKKVINQSTFKDWVKYYVKSWAVYPIISYRGTELSILKLLITIMLILGATMIARLLSQVIVRRISSEEISSGNKIKLQKIIFFTLWMISIVAIFRYVGVSIEILKFIGGFFAVAIGFGFQNVFKNMTGAFILLWDNSLKVGDMIDFDGKVGRIVKMNLFNVRLELPNKSDLFIPNTLFLEKQTTNWHRTDFKHRLSIEVGVNYKTEIKKVEESLYKVAKEIEEVLAYPEPRVVFFNFGPNALVFKLYGWANIVSELQKQEIASGLRKKILNEFRSAGIEIAYPQRDIHIKAIPELGGGQGGLSTGSVINVNQRG